MTETRILKEASAEKTEEKLEIIAVSAEDVARFGCPYCGFRSGSSGISGGSSGATDCGECRKTFCVLGRGVSVSSIGFGQKTVGFNQKKDPVTFVYPKLQEHPRRGIPSHGRPDKRPEGGGEFFFSRGIGNDCTPGCFICGGPEDLYENIAAYVQCKEAGERIVAMFKHGARLDYREYEPDRVQVKIGACKKHIANLKALEKSTKDAGSIITELYISGVSAGY